MVQKMRNGRKKVVVEFRDSILSSIYQPVRWNAQCEQQIQEVWRELERVRYGGTAKQVVVIEGGY